MSALVHVRQRGQPKRPDHNQQGARPPNSTLFGLRYKHRPPRPVSRHRLIQTSRGTPGGATVIARTRTSPAGAHGDHRSFVARGGPSLSARHGRAKPGDRRVPRRRHRLPRPQIVRPLRITCVRAVAWVWHGPRALTRCLKNRSHQDPKRGGGRNRTAVRGFAVTKTGFVAVYEDSSPGQSACRYGAVQPDSGLLCHPCAIEDGLWRRISRPSLPNPRTRPRNIGVS